MKDRDSGSSINPDEAISSGRVLFRGARLVLAAMATGMAVGCGSGAGARPCPTNEAGVSQVVGGYPANWRALDGIRGAWAFESEEGQNLTGSYGIGRLEILDGNYTNGSKKTGNVLFWETIKTRRGFYVCVNEGDSESQSPATPSPGSTPTISSR